MKPSHLIGTVCFAGALLACERRPLAGPAVQPLVLGAAPAGQEQPLVFVNGRQVGLNSLRELDKSVIQSVEVFKGAMALRLYGEQGRHGVIVIQTK
ncbi:MAG: TonB-dependent receptor [Gemmatimonadales bacterium]